jgi:ACS family hexuronate transporter-like MFS transporter
MPDDAQMAAATAGVVASPAITTDRALAVGRVRWGILALLFFATTINYIDRQVVGILKPTLAADLHWSEIDYANIVFYFQMAYAIGYLITGRLMDVLGVKRAFALCVFV